MVMRNDGERGGLMQIHIANKAFLCSKCGQVCKSQNNCVHHVAKFARANMIVLMVEMALSNRK